MDIAIVGEPVAEPHFATIAEARRVMPSASILYVRPGACPVDGQIESLIKHLAAPGNESTGENAKTFASVSALSNDGDYPVPGKFTNLEGSVAANMAAAALVLDDTSPIPVPYSSSPAVLLASAALSLVGIPDEDKYDGDIEIALIEWSLRVNDLLGGAPHIVAPDVFVPVPYPSSRPNAQKTTFLSEIAVWHPNFPQIQKQAAEQDFFKATRKAMKKIPIEEQENGKLNLLSEADTDQHVGNILSKYSDLMSGRYSNFEDLVLQYAMSTKGSLAQATTFLYALLAVITIT